ncbi:MAG: TraI domain-containing protein [Betaproteobacteria bacterium]|nr:TraI domain-containing protein [Betaproteobacteria bacterium]
MMKREGRSALGSVLAGAGTLLLGRRLPTNTSQRKQEEIVIAPAAELPVLGFHALIERTRTASLVELLRIKLGFPREVFERAVRPVIEGYAEFVQLLPALESRRHANPGGLFTHALEVVSRALDYRRGQILPRGAPPEVIGAQAHRWTYAVFVAALLSGVGKYMLDAHEKLAVQLLDRFVPPSVLEWLAEDPALMRELLAFLSGENSARAGAISELVLRAAAELVSNDHLHRGRADPTVQQTALAATSRDVKSDPGFDRPATTPQAPVAAQSGAAAQATNEPNLSDEETEYLEDVDERDRESAATSRSRDSAGEAVPLTGTVVSPSWQSRMADPEWAQAPEAARRFIGWLQQELSDGTLRVNGAGALVHFVDEGMLLVSPRIFREFAKRFGEDGRGIGPTIATHEPDIGKSIQRQLLRACWHLRADNGVNILTYQVMRGDRAVSKLSGVVIRNPARFVNPVSPVNPVLVRLLAKSGDA